MCDMTNGQAERRYCETERDKVVTAARALSAVLVERDFKDDDERLAWDSVVAVGVVQVRRAVEALDRASAKATVR